MFNSSRPINTLHYLYLLFNNKTVSSFTVSLSNLYL